MKRRQFLQGAAGATVALPLLPSLSARADAGDFPQRLVFMYAPNGVPVGTWWPAAGATERDFQLASAMTPLAPHRDDITIVGGLELGTTGPGGPHARGMGALLTAQSLQEGTMPSNNGQLAGWADGVSLDQYLAQQLRPETPFPSLEIAVRGDNYRATNMSRLSYAGPGAPLTPQSDPAVLWQRLFPGVDQAPTDEAIRRTVLDTVREQFAVLRGRVGTEDRDVLDAHLGFVSDLQSRITADPIMASCSEGAAMPIIDDVNGDGDPDADADLTMSKVAEAQVDLLAAAVGCNLTRIATFQFANAWDRVVYPWVSGPSKTGHDISHAGNGDTVAQTAWTEIARYQMSLMARLIQTLKNMPEGDGSVLDHTAIVWTSEVAVGNTHSHRNLPVVIAGSLGGKLRTGQYLRFDGRFHADLLTTLKLAMGVDGESFGLVQFNQGPLPGLLV
jgi:hypothetical protein